MQHWLHTISSDYKERNVRKGVCVLVAMLVCFAAKTYFGRTGSASNQSLLVATASALPPAANSACQLPTQAPDPNNPQAVAQTAWQIFVAINCPANANQLVWESWIEQYSLFTSPGQTPTTQRFHGSPLGLILAGKSGASLPQITPSTPCQAMKAPPSNMPQPGTKPKDRKGTFCEEVHLDPTAQQYVTSNGFQLRAGQQKAVTSHATIEFPTTAVEVKADWIPANDFSQPPFKCDGSAQGLHLEMVNGQCYALIGMHISSKLLPKWLWATFEAQNATTNPERCKPDFFGPCNDPYGSQPAQSSGEDTQLTPAVTALMQQAGLAPEFSNYRMDGAQTGFGTTQNPNLLGNSIVEGETVGLMKAQASCITCHFSSAINAAGAENLTGLSKVGPPPALPAGYLARDFAWSLGVACPNSVFNANPNCPSSSSAVTKPKKQ